MSIIKFLGFLIFLLDKFLAITNKFLFCASVGVAGVQPDRAARAGAAAGADREAHGQGGAVSAGPRLPAPPYLPQLSSYSLYITNKSETDSHLSSSV